MIVFAITIQMAIPHFLTYDPSEVLNGQQQHKAVIFNWYRISPSLVKLF